MVPGERLAGIRFWAQWYSLAIPKYEVFVYTGTSPDVGTYWFRSKKNGTTIGKSFYQLNINGFLPFCYTTKELQKHLQGGP